MKRKLLTVLKLMGINSFIAAKCKYNDCCATNDFYNMLIRRLKIHTPQYLAEFLKNELNIHYKEYAQYI